jgi:hypothetical protein
MLRKAYVVGLLYIRKKCAVSVVCVLSPCASGVLCAESVCFWGTETELITTRTESRSSGRMAAVTRKGVLHVGTFISRA